jgi:hypothetical protein
VPGVPFVGVRESALQAYMTELPHFAYGLGTVPSGYVDPTRIKPTYARKGTTQMPREGSPAADVMPPDYTSAADSSPLAPVASAVGSSAIWIGAGVAGLIVVAGLMRRR